MSDGIYARWRKHVIDGKGKSSGIEGIRHYDGDTMFEWRLPTRRLVSDGTGNWLELRGYRKEMNSVNLRRLMYGSQYGAPAISIAYVPCVGTFTPFPGDRVYGEELLRRLQFSCVHDLVWLCTQFIPGIPVKTLTADGYMNGRGEVEYVQHSTGWFDNTINAHYERYAFLNDWFGACWEQLPYSYHEEAMAGIKAKIVKFNDPDSARKRERARARKLASKVLLDD